LLNNAALFTPHSNTPVFFHSRSLWLPPATAAAAARSTLRIHAHHCGAVELLPSRHKLESQV